MTVMKAMFLVILFVGGMTLVVGLFDGQPVYSGAGLALCAVAALGSMLSDISRATDATADQLEQVVAELQALRQQLSQQGRS